MKPLFLLGIFINFVLITAPETVFDQIDNATHATAVPVAMMHYQYNALNEDALTLNLMLIVNSDQLQDVPNAASPYLTQQLFAAAPKELVFESSTASFVLTHIVTPTPYLSANQICGDSLYHFWALRIFYG